jgi:hypothetical protein
MQNNNQNGPKFRTDLNDRERTRYAKHFREISLIAIEIVKALETGDDDSLVKNFTFYQIKGISERELVDIILKTVVGTAADIKDDPEFPSFIHPKI